MKDLSSIRKKKQEVEDSLLKIPGVNAVDVGKKIVKGKRTDELAIRVYVTDKKAKKDIPDDEQIPSKVGKFKTDVIQMKFRPHVVRKKVSELALMADTGRYDPLQGGISIGPCRAVGGYIYVGTLGMIVNDNTTDDQMMLSNFHVMALNNSWSAGDTMAQPSRVDGGSCPADVVGELSRASLGGSVDCAVATLDTERDVACSIQDIGDISGIATASIGENVRKRGRTTELTYGTIDSIDLTVIINYDGVGDVTLTDQIGIDVDTAQSNAFGLGGDSGSVVVNASNEVIGLYFAGNIEQRDDDGNIILEEGVFGIANPIAEVLTEMDVSVCLPKRKPELKEIKEKEKDKEFKEVKEFKEKDKDKDIKEKEKEGKEIKEKEKEKDKEGKEIKEKEKDKEVKEFKEKEKDKDKELKEIKEKDRKEFKEKDKDIFENPGDNFNNPITRRIEALENTVNQLSHFIESNLRPDLSRSSYKNEQDLQKEYRQKSKKAKQYKDQKDSEHLY
ncbi:hypothetical protein [Zunongwangia sp. H14]|uniref:hypothetical protein n=1 Tax=Zunongwangia sp. H14 TaxID=3240792 RepID=UPI003567E848